jgi:hypothetical protein
MNLSTILQEFNPKYDMSNHIYDNSLIDEQKHLGLYMHNEFKDAGFFLINSTKAVIRGGVAGAVVGGLAGLAIGLSDGDNYAQYAFGGALAGGTIGAGIDLLQYHARYAYLDCRRRISRTKNVFTGRLH